MSSFFIERPVLAWVIASLIMIGGIVSIPRLPITRYPNIAPPSVEIDAIYPGASAKTVEDSVTQIIEQNMTGIDGLLCMESSSSNNGSVTIKLTFVSHTNPDTAQVQVQNRLQQATPLLPQIVQQQGIVVSKSTPAFMQVIGFVSEDGSLSAGDISDYVATTVVDPMSRVQGVGSLQLFGSKYAMRIWLDPDKLNTYSQTPADVIAAIQAQNAQISVGQLGDLPSVAGQQLNATISALGRLRNPEQFRNIILRSNSDGSTLRLGDVARVELGAADYTFSSSYNGHPACGIGITLATGANALKTAQGVEALLDKLKPQFPYGLKAITPYDATGYIRRSIEQVVITLGEAILLVFLVMLLFLRNLRATLIPTIAVPVVLLGTFAVLGIAGFSINMMTIFAVVLAIGLLVDDAIIVVENVERLMSHEGLTPIEATRRSMEQIRGALVGVATVLSAVFVPMAFLQGGIGVIYRQFAVTIVTAMILSVVIALVLTPALCASLLRPPHKSDRTAKRGLVLWCAGRLDWIKDGYQRVLAHILRRTIRYLVLYVALLAIMCLMFFRLPTAFLPDEDEGYLFTLVQAPAGATQARTLKVLDQVREYFFDHEKDAVVSTFQIAGFNFNGQGQNTGFGFVVLKDWDERKEKRFGMPAIQQRANHAVSEIKDAQVFVLAPPPDTDLGTSSGFDFYLKDTKGQGYEALMAARDQFLALAADDKLLVNVRPSDQDNAPQLRLDIDQQKAASFGLTLKDVNDTLATVLAGSYIDDFIDRDRVKRVIVEADAPFRMVPENIGRWHVRNSRSDMVSVASFAHSHWEFMPTQLERYNGFSATQIDGEAAPGVSSGDAMKEIERLAAQLPLGFAPDFTGQSYEERSALAQTPILYTLSIAIVFLCLAALYESWSMPIAILLAVPLGIIGAVVATALCGMERDVYFQIAMLTTIGLASKNAILIVEFAKENVVSGMSLVEATLRAARDRVRPILMTSFAFGFGVLPLAIATGASAGAQRAIGTGVLGGMLAGTLLGIFFIPLFFVVVQRLFHGATADSEL
jgi:multidrug efflux pump